MVMKCTMVFTHINIKIVYITILRKYLSLMLFYVDALYHRLQTGVTGPTAATFPEIKGVANLHP